MIAHVTDSKGWAEVRMRVYLGRRMELSGWWKLGGDESRWGWWGGGVCQL